ncbi:MAG: hypothetical protein ACOYN4_00920 [Bacteroidales bacterium]
MEIYNNRVCIPANQYYHEYSDAPGVGEIIKENFVSYSSYKKQVVRKTIRISRHARGEGNYALIELDSLPPQHLAKIYERDPNPARTAFLDPSLHSVKKDYQALEFYTTFHFPDGNPIRTDKVNNILLWNNGASILNTVASEYKNHVRERTKQGYRPLNSQFFANAAKFVTAKAVTDRFPNNLPTNPVRLREKFEEYSQIGYVALIKQNAGNNNATKISDKIQKLICFIATMPTRPYNTKVVEVYNDFMNGKIELVDKATGVQFIPEDYLDKNGNVVSFTEARVWQLINQPGLQVKVDKKRLGAKDFNDIHRPHRHRHNPEFSFSKISLDDRDLVWKDSVTKQRVKAYYAYDVTSGCRVGSAYSMDKNEELFLDCLRDMFVFIDRHGFGIPLEVEVENHLVNKFFADLSVMFPYLTICAPGNSQEKRAEHFNRYVKYTIEKNNHPGIGRWWLKSKYNRVPVDRVGADFIQKMKPMDRLIADDILDTIQYNNAPHPNKKLYPGMTRMQVLIDNLNPTLPKFKKDFIYRYIGYATETSIVRNQYLSVQDGKYMLPSPYVLEKLKPNNRSVTAYWMPEEDGNISEIYIYQDGQFICTAEKLITYNEAKGERTEIDNQAKLKQDKYVAMFDKMIGDAVADFPKVEIITKSTGVHVTAAPVIAEEPKLQPSKSFQDSSEIDWAKKATDDFFN